MAETAYDYSVSTDFPYGVKPGMLQGQIEDSDIASGPREGDEAW
jgi:hypothetical protein